MEALSEAFDADGFVEILGHSGVSAFLLDRGAFIGGNGDDGGGCDFFLGDQAFDLKSRLEAVHDGHTAVHEHELDTGTVAVLIAVVLL